MNFVINDLALNQQSKNVYDSISNMRTFISLIKKLKEDRIVTAIYSDKKFRGVQLAPNYFFEQMLNDERLSRDERAYLRTAVVNSSRIAICDDKLFELFGMVSYSIAHAYFNNMFLVSVRTSELYIKPYVHGILHADSEIYEVDIPNVSDVNDIEVHKFRLGIRVYENNPKHKINYGWGSPMDLSDSVAQQVLDTAISVPDNPNHLINRYGNKYYSFRRHHQNCFHGYIDNGIPENIKKLISN